MDSIAKVVRRELHNAFEWGTWNGRSGILATEEQVINEGEFQIMAVIAKEVRDAGGIQQDGGIEADGGVYHRNGGV